MDPALCPRSPVPDRLSVLRDRVAAGTYRADPLLVADALLRRIAIRHADTIGPFEGARDGRRTPARTA